VRTVVAGIGGTLGICIGALVGQERSESRQRKLAYERAVHVAEFDPHARRVQVGVALERQIGTLFTELPGDRGCGYDCL
jgi:hypothetical protein